MSFFNTSATLKRVSRLPPGTDRDRAVRLLLHDHDFFVHCGPHSVEWEAVSPDEEARLATAALDADAQGVQPLPAAVREAREAVWEAWTSAQAAADAADAVEESDAGGDDDGADVDAGGDAGGSVNTHANGSTKGQEEDGQAESDKSSAETPETPETSEIPKPPPVSRTYHVTDVVHTLPAGLWDSRVVSTYEMTNLEGGLFVRVRSPMSIVMDTTWSVEVVVPEPDEAESEAEDENEAQAVVDDKADSKAEDTADSKTAEKLEALELHEEIVIYCSRLLIGTVKSLCESDWQEIHKRMVARLEDGEEEAWRERSKKGETAEEEDKKKKEEGQENAGTKDEAEA